jgi:hypothetical protein
MQGKSFIRMLASTSMALVFCSVVASVPAPAESPDARCSNRTLKGSYGFTIEGTIVGPNIQIRGLALQNYDGRGNITQLDHLVSDGVPPDQDWTSGTGTYSVNPDCTGDAVINSPSNPFPVHLHFVIVNNGNEIRQVVDANAVVAVGIKVSQED